MLRNCVNIVWVLWAVGYMSYSMWVGSCFVCNLYHTHRYFKISSAKKINTMSCLYLFLFNTKLFFQLVTFYLYIFATTILYLLWKLTLSRFWKVFKTSRFYSWIIYWLWKCCHQIVPDLKYPLVQRYDVIKMWPNVFFIY